MRGNTASLILSTDNPGAGSFIALTVTASIYAFPAYWTFIAALSIGG
jgi:hypothetical protein